MTAAMRGASGEVEHLVHHGGEARLGDLAVAIEAARDQGRRRRRVGILGALGGEVVEEHLVARVRLARGVDRLRRRALLDLGGRRRRDLVGERIPVDGGVVDDHLRDRLVDDALHDLGDHPLLDEAALLERVVGLELVAQVPVAEQAQPARERPRPGRAVDEVVHEDVVFGDVQPGRRLGGVAPRQHRRRHAPLERLRQAHLGPLPPRPLLALSEPLGERRQREVGERDERDLAGEEIVGEMGRRVELGSCACRARSPARGRARRAAGARAPSRGSGRAALLEHLLEADEHAVERAAGRRELLGDELLAIGLAAVLGAPQRRHLLGCPARSARGRRRRAAPGAARSRRTRARESSGRGESGFSRGLHFGRTNRKSLQRCLFRSGENAIRIRRWQWLGQLRGGQCGGVLRRRRDAHQDQHRARVRLVRAPPADA